MIAISESLIRSVRRLSVDDEREATAVEHLLSSSPTRGDQFSQDPHIGPAKKHAAAGQGQMQRGLSSRNIQEEDERDDHESAAAPQPAPQPAVSSTHVVRFDPNAADDKSKQRSAEPTFAKEPVEKKVALSSSLSRELISSGNLRAARVGPMDRAGPATGPTLVLQVFTEVSKPPMKVKIVGAMTVEEVIELIIRQHEEQKRKPALAHRTADRYDLRMVDEDDGTPDLDMPPLDRHGRIHKFEVEAVALVERAEPAAPKRGAAFSPPTSPTNRGVPSHGTKPSQGFNFNATGEDPPITVRPQRGMSLEINQGAKPGRFFLKIHMPNHVSHVIPVAPEQTLEDILPLIAKKRSVQAQNERVAQEILPQHFKFVYLGDKDALDMRLNLSELKSDELMLLPRVGADEDLKPISEVNGNGMSNLANNLLTREIADMYTEYKVIKTNQRGKRQERIMGIDGEKIYNKSIEAGSDSVHRAYIRIPDVLSCEQLPDLPRSFRIVFRDKNSIEVREYEADTKMEAAQIVAKINYLKNL